MENLNPLIGLDYPDPDIIRVESVYYMISTTMYFFPGGEILRSSDLVHWEHAAFVFDRLDSTDSQTLRKGNIYGKGMWAASLRFHRGKFYVCFVANDTQQTYLYTANSIEGPWLRKPMKGFYHDCSLLFDDDRVFIAYGNTDIHVTELLPDLSGPKPNGVDKIVVSDKGNPFLGYEGSHFYKINGKYLLFFIHSRRDKWRRTESCFVADRPEGPYIGRDVFDEDLGRTDAGCAQGGIVDTPDGRWFSIVFQDRGASGRIPVLVPVHFEEGWPIFGEHGSMPTGFRAPLPVDESCTPLADTDDFKGTGDVGPYGCFGLKSTWQFNHEPTPALTRLDRNEGAWTVTTGKLCSVLTEAQNTITQRLYEPVCAVEVTVDGSELLEGDYAGLCALQGCYAFVGLTKRNDRLFVIMKEQRDGELSERESACVPWNREKLRIRMHVDFTDRKDLCQFYLVSEKDENHCAQSFGPQHKLFFHLDHFTGARAGLVVYATETPGGSASFSDFRLTKLDSCSAS